MRFLDHLELNFLKCKREVFIFILVYVVIHSEEIHLLIILSFLQHELFNSL